MKLFGKRNSGVVWRDANGKIDCPGDACQKDCDNSCPIWVNTMCLKMMQMGQYQSAISNYKKAIEIAPDFSDLWSNMAGCYGAMSKYEEAFNAYKKAYELAGKKPALYGLAISARDCGKKEEALEYCSKYKKKFGDGALDKVEKQLKSAIDKTENSPLYMKMLVELLKNGTENGYVDFSGSVPFIPELSSQANMVCMKIYKDLNDAIDANPNINADAIEKFNFTARWCMFAGMGAVWYWNEDWEKLKNKGIVEMLSEPEGVDCIDDVVLDAVGIGRMSEESREFRNYIDALLYLAISKIPESAQKDGQSLMSALMERNKAMYMFGIAVEMYRLGMK